MSDVTNNYDSVDGLDLAIIRNTQTGLSVCRQPYQAVADALGLDTKVVMQHLRDMLQQGVIRRIAVVPNHYALGYTENAMAVWDVPDEYVDKAGKIIGGLDFVSHCYQRTRHPPDWPYNLFAMVHGRNRDSTEQKIAMITELLGENNRGSAVLYSKRILKKTGIRI